jgi:hypothetical protein
MWPVSRQALRSSSSQVRATTLTLLKVASPEIATQAIRSPSEDILGMVIFNGAGSELNGRSLEEGTAQIAVMPAYIKRL